MRPVVALLASLLLAMVPAVQGGTAAEPDIVDPAGDVQFDGLPPPQPCVDAVDLLSFWVEWTSDGAMFHYAFNDLSAVEGPPVQEATGWCFYSYTDFVLTRADGPAMEDSLYVDYRGNPAFQTGWRFFLIGSDADAIGTVDIAAGTIDVLVPSAALGDPGPGDELGMFRVQSTTQMVGTSVGGDFATDFSPEGEPCPCPVPFPGPDPGAPAPADDDTPASSSGSQSASSSASATSAPGTVRPPASQSQAIQSSSGSDDAPQEPAKESPAAPWLALVALLGAMAARRRWP